MSDGVPINWGRLNTPDPLQNYQAAFLAGHALASQRGGVSAPPQSRFNAGTAAAPNLGAMVPQVATSVGGRADPREVQSIQDHIAAMSPSQRQAASQAQEQFATILNGLKLQTTDPRQRLAMAQHLAGLHPEFGIDPNAISPDDVTDQGIAGHVAAALFLKSQLDAAPAGERSALPGSPVTAAPLPRGGDNSEAWEKAEFYRRAAMLGAPARTIDSLWARYVTTHHGGLPASPSGPWAASPMAPMDGHTMSDADLVAALTAPPLRSGAHTLSDHDLKSALEL